MLQLGWQRGKSKLSSLFRDGSFFIYKFIRRNDLMLDLRFLRENYEKVKEKLVGRGEDLTEFEQFPALDEQRRKLITKTEKLKAERNEASKQISVLKREGKDATEAITNMREVAAQIKQYDEELSDVQEKLDHVMLSIPNIPHESVPYGESEDENEVVRTWGEKPRDRKSTRLNSSHVAISYAVFCLKKKR